MDWVNTAEEYCGRYGWGARGKHIGISRMMNDNDKAALTQNKMVAAIRPRGILSGFLAIVPSLDYAVFLPPIAAKIGPQRIRMRLSDTIKERGAILSAYITRDKTMVLEDVLVWDDKPVWFTEQFRSRWIQLMGTFTKEGWKDDKELQGFSIVLANYVQPASLEEPEGNFVVEFVPSTSNQKRLIWVGSSSPSPRQQHVPQSAQSAQSAQSVQLHPLATSSSFVAKKEVGMGPDVYSIYRNEERLGLGLVRTLPISRALRAGLEKGDTIPVSAVFNKQFEKWEILTVL